MPDPDDLRKLLQLLAPGFVILGIRQWFMVTEAPKFSDRAFTYAAVSAAYFALAAPTVTAVCGWLKLNELTRDSWEFFWLPALIGLAYTWLGEHEWPDRLWSTIGLKPVHRIRGAWDFAFRYSEEGFVLVTLKDGTEVAGFFGKGSFASSAGEKRDILISNVYTIDENGVWAESTPSKSVLVLGADIQAVTFLRSES